MEEITLNAKAVLRKAMEMILSEHQQQYGGQSGLGNIGPSSLMLMFRFQQWLSV